MKTLPVSMQGLLFYTGAYKAQRMGRAPKIPRSNPLESLTRGAVPAKVPGPGSQRLEIFDFAGVFDRLFSSL